MSLISRGNIISAMRPGVNKHYGLTYKDWPAIYSRLFETFKSDKNFEVDVNVNGFELASVKGESDAIKYTSHQEAFHQFYNNFTVALAYQVTREELEDNLYPNLVRSRSMELARSMQITKETLAHGILNRAIDPLATWADGKSLLATDHLLSKGGTFSNKLAVPMDLSEKSLEDLCIQIRRWTDDAGKPVRINPIELFIPPELEYTASRILGSDLQNDTANNALNALKRAGAIRRITVSPFLDDPDAYFIKTDCMDGLKHFERRAVELKIDVADFDTENVKVKSTERYCFGISDLRGIAGSEGAV